ncbi:beta strand repeat-containing protein [Nocardioides abyssi]|uniref:Uncharacterized protein n=1 Tax=Nocardioides abyssi TaxID=3058370 RepID=A0ABT8EXQ1_9ACTN|nr:hypothetical protein [Nocardioides abyssi]MDN4162940.1 hypothetical protein [Nocardioides abyssi]
MAMRDEGYVEEVSVVKRGTYLVEDAPVGASFLLVEDASDFNDDGGTLQINGEVIDYTTANYVGNVLTLAAPLAGAAVRDAEVAVYPESMEKQAQVSVGDDSEAITAVVTHALFSRLKEGFRGDVKEAVALELIGGTWFVVDVIGETPSKITDEELDEETVLQPIFNAAEMAAAALAEAEAAMGFAVAKNKSFRQDEEPTDGMVDGDIWFDTDNGNKIYVYDSVNGWVAADAALAQEVLDAIEDAKADAALALQQSADAINAANAADAKAGTAQTAADNALSDAADAFTEATNASTAASTADAAAAAAAQLADEKNKVFVTDVEPTSGMDVNDLWINTAYQQNTLYIWSGTEWARHQDSTIAYASNAAANALGAAQAAQSTAANSSMTYIQSNAPTGRAQDLWIDTTSGANTPKRWNGSAWVAVTDKAATDAAAAATASSKTYIQNTAPTGRSQDLWIDTTNGANTPKRWNGTAWVAVSDKIATDAAAKATQAIADAAAAATAASNAQTKADQASTDAATAAGIANGKAVVLYQTTTPAASYQNSNTLWIDLTGSSNTPKRWSGSAWVAVSDKAATDAASAAAAAQSAANAAATAAQTAQTTAEGKGRVYYQTTAPASANQYDLWVDITAGANTPKRWNGLGWFPVTDKVATDAAAAASAAQSAASGALTAAQAKTTVYYQTTAPGSTNGQDLWVDTTAGANTPKRYNGSAWVPVTDKVATDAAALAGQANTAAGNAQTTANAKATVYFQNTPPASTLPQDLWIDTTNAANTPKRYISGAWTAVTDKVATDAAALASTANNTANTALQNANNAATTANGKNKVIFSTATASGTSGYVAGDIWFQRDAGNNIIGQWEFTGTGWASRYLSDAVLASLTVGKLQTGTLGAIEINMGTGGIIKSNDYNQTNKTGWRLGTGGLEIWNGVIKGSLVETSTLVVSQSNVTGLPTALSDRPTASTVTSQINTAVAAKTTTFAQGTVPTSTAAGDLWINTAASNKMYRANAAGATAIVTTGNGWYLVNDPTATSGGIKTFAQNTVPTSTASGDLWVNTGDNNKMYRANAAGVSAIVTTGNGWYLTQDPVGAANTAQTNAQNYADTQYGGTKNLVTSWTTPGQTTIAGGKLETNSVKADAVDALAITAKHTITGAMHQTDAAANVGIKFNSAAFIAYGGGTETFSITAATGAVAMKGELKSGSTISGALISGPLETASGATVGTKITSNGIIGYYQNSPMFTMDTSTGSLTVKGTIKSGSTIEGATLTGLLQTNSGNIGPKISTSGIYMYNNSGQQTFGASATSGSVSFIGALTAGTTVDGAIVTGGTIQTTANTYNGKPLGIKMNSTGFTAYDNFGDPTFTITGSTGAVAMKGTLTAGSNISGATITGSSFTTNTAGNPRITMGPGSGLSDNQIALYNNYTVLPGGLSGDGLQSRQSTFITSPTGQSGNSRAQITLTSWNASGSREVSVLADYMSIPPVTIGTGYQQLGGISGGQVTTNTNSASQVTITHSLGAVPKSVVCMGDEAYGSSRHNFTLVSMNSSTFTLTVRNTAGGLVSSPTKFTWLAIA